MEKCPECGLKLIETKFKIGKEITLMKECYGCGFYKTLGKTFSTKKRSNKELEAIQ